MRVTLRKHKDKAVRRGYPWIFSNQISTITGSPRTGDVVEIVGADGKVYGRGFYHARSLIAVRFLTNDPDVAIDAAFFHDRLRQALALRTAAYPESTHYRLVFSEADGLPGTVIDRYHDVLTWTTLCAGMDARREVLLDGLDALLRPAAIIERNDAPLRAKDGLPEAKGVLRGHYDGPIGLEEQGVRYLVDVLNGPKTGFFLDQRHHREVVRRFAPGRRVLDVCCADGGFGLQAAHAGAASVHFVDVSAAALDRARTNAARNGLLTVSSFEQADVLDHLSALVETDTRFDLIVLDPPGFAKSRRHVEQATRAYQRININALKLLPPGGILATASCSQAIDEAAFLKIVYYSARKVGVPLRLLYRGSQPLDHPVLPAMPETHYLKFYVFQRIDTLLPA